MNMKKNILYPILFIVVVTLPLMAEGQRKETYKFVERDSSLFLDVYHPERQRPDRACVVSLFGGGFVAGSRDSEYQTTIAHLLNDKGFTVVSIDYRLGLKDTAMVAKNKGLLGIQDLFQYCIDIAVEDCAAALAWVCNNAALLDIDTSKIILTGSSAGAITVLQTDWSRANGLEKTSVLPQGWKPAAVIPFSGGIMCRRNQLRYTTPPAPTMMLHGKKDKIVAYNKMVPLLSRNLYGSNRVAKVMQKGNYPYWIVRFPGIGHEVATWLPSSIDLFCAFVDQALAGRVTTLDATMTDTQLVPTRWTTMTIKDLYAK